ncbi:MAG: hypothetical protein PHF73_08425, partial [Massilibacteroides sp.]|nr:hypothetical protein [Massilibacteroides sp.]
LFSESFAFFSSFGAALIFFASVFWIKPKNEVGSKGQRPFKQKGQALRPAPTKQKAIVVVKCQLYL